MDFFKCFSSKTKPEDQAPRDAPKPQVAQRGEQTAGVPRTQESGPAGLNNSGDKMSEYNGSTASNFNGLHRRVSRPGQQDQGVDDVSDGSYMTKGSVKTRGT